MTKEKKEELEKAFSIWRDENGGWPSRTECFEWFISQFDNIMNEKIVQLELKKIERQGAYNTADIKLGEMKGLDLAIAILKE